MLRDCLRLLFLVIGSDICEHGHPPTAGTTQRNRGCSPHVPTTNLPVGLKSKTDQHDENHDLSSKPSVTGQHKSNPGQYKCGTETTSTKPPFIGNRNQENGNSTTANWTVDEKERYEKGLKELSEALGSDGAKTTPFVGFIRVLIGIAMLVVLL